MTPPDVQAIRAELATLAELDGWTSYAYTPGSATLPAVVVGLPTRMRPEGLRLWRIELPVWVLIGNVYTEDAEAQIVTAAFDVAAALRGKSGTAFRGCAVPAIDEFLMVKVGNADALSATIRCELLGST